MSYSWYMIGERIRSCRKEKGWTQEQLAASIADITNTELKRQTVAGWENGKPVKKIEQLKAMCDLFGCDTGYLLCEYDCKHVLTDQLGSMLGLTAEAVDALIEYRRQGSKCSRIACDLIEDRDLLLRIFDCCNADYENRFTGEIEVSGIKDYFQGAGGSRKIHIMPDKLKELDFMLLYDDLKKFVASHRPE